MNRELLLNIVYTSAAVALALIAILFSPTPSNAASACKGQMVRASWYGAESGSRTASGMHFDGTQWLVAHKSLPFGTKLRISYAGRSVTVTVQDRGPYIAGRTLDLSHAVAVALGTIRAGAPWVCMERL